MTDIVELLRVPKGCVSTGISVDVLNAAADEIERLRNQLADWTRRSESCESKLGQLEANERVIELEQLRNRLAAYESGMLVQINRTLICAGSRLIEENTALKEAIRQAKREVLIDAAGRTGDEVVGARLLRMAEELT